MKKVKGRTEWGMREKRKKRREQNRIMNKTERNVISKKKRMRENKKRKDKIKIRGRKTRRIRENRQTIIRTRKEDKTDKGK